MLLSSRFTAFGLHALYIISSADRPYWKCLSLSALNSTLTEPVDRADPTFLHWFREKRSPGKRMELDQKWLWSRFQVVRAEHVYMRGVKMKVIHTIRIIAETGLISDWSQLGQRTSSQTDVWMGSNADPNSRLARSTKMRPHLDAREEHLLEDTPGLIPHTQGESGGREGQTRARVWYAHLGGVQTPIHHRSWFRRDPGVLLLQSELSEVNRNKENVRGTMQPVQNGPASLAVMQSQAFNASLLKGIKEANWICVT